MGPSPGSQHSHWQGCRGQQGIKSVLEAGRSVRAQGVGVVRALGASRGLVVVRGHWGQQGCRALGWQVDWMPNHIWPQSRVPALPLVGGQGALGPARGVGVLGALGL